MFGFPLTSCCLNIAAKWKSAYSSALGSHILRTRKKRHSMRQSLYGNIDPPYRLCLVSHIYADPLWVVTIARIYDCTYLLKEQSQSDSEQYIRFSALFFSSVLKARNKYSCNFILLETAVTITAKLIKILKHDLHPVNLLSYMIMATVPFLISQPILNAIQPNLRRFIHLTLVYSR